MKFKSLSVLLFVGTAFLACERPGQPENIQPYWDVLKVVQDAIKHKDQKAFSATLSVLEPTPVLKWKAADGTTANTESLYPDEAFAKIVSYIEANPFSDVREFREKKTATEKTDSGEKSFDQFRKVFEFYNAQATVARVSFRKTSFAPDEQALPALQGDHYKIESIELLIPADL